MSHPIPDSKFDCQPIEALHRGVDLGKVRDCMVSLKTPVSLRYRLRKVPEPFLELEDEESSPTCIKESLPRIPVPRELIFQSAEEGALECYSARVALESDEVPALGVKWPLARTVMTLQLGKGQADEGPDAQRKLGLLLDTWAMSIFFESRGGGRRAIRAHLIPQAICERCMGEKNLIRKPFGADVAAPQLVWPEELSPK